MPEELLVILGAEATLLVFVTAMSLYRKRMDVLSELHRRAARGGAGRHSKPSPHSIRARAWVLLSLPKAWTGTGRLTQQSLAAAWKRPIKPDRGAKAARPFVARFWRPAPSSDALPLQRPCKSDRRLGAR